MKSVMKHSFSEVPSANIQRSSFNRSHGVKTTFDAGGLYPIFCDEVLPGDTFNLRTSAFGRMATPIFPVMDNMFIETFYFFVPNRLVWDNWQRFMGEQKKPTDSTDFLVPTGSFKATGPSALADGLIDHFGLPTDPKGELKANLLPLRAYNLIWNEWFRDQNLQNPADVDTGDADDSATYVILPRGKRHDYFTSCLPWPQKGPTIDVPIGQTAPVIPNNSHPTFNIRNASSGSPTGLLVTGMGDSAISADPNYSGTGAYNPLTWDDPQLTADLSDVAAVTINSLRQAFQMQRMAERDARGGTRYVEIIRSHFLVNSPDARQQRPEYLGGGSSPLNITPIASTTDTESIGGQRSVGDLGAMATTSFKGHGFSKSFTEHGYVIGLINVRADLTYQQGINRMWSRLDKYDFYWPALAHLGEQEVLNKEIFHSNTDDDEAVFGYQERYAEYRYKPSEIHGAFRSNYPSGSLDPWHLSQDFETLPKLSAEFIQDNPPIDRVIQTPGEPQFIFDLYHKLICARPMPMFGVPGYIDRM